MISHLCKTCIELEVCLIPTFQAVVVKEVLLG